MPLHYTPTKIWTKYVPPQTRGENENLVVYIMFFKKTTSEVKEQGSLTSAPARETAVNETRVFNSYDEYYEELKYTPNLNGVSAEFAEKHPNFVKYNSTNKRCWNCISCTRCYSCEDCDRCDNCSHCLECEYCFHSYFSVYCENCIGVIDGSDLENQLEIC